MGKKTEAEHFEEAQRHAEALLAAMPEPEQSYAGGEEPIPPVEADPEAEADALDRGRILRLERMVEQLTARSTQIAVAGVAEMPPTAPRRPYTQAELNELVTVTLFENSDPNENRPIPLAPEGDLRWLPRGIPTRIPRKHLLVLIAAQIESVEHPIENGRYVAQKTDLSPMTTTPGVVRKTPRFHFSVSEEAR